MTDISPLSAIDRLNANDGTEHSLLTGVSNVLGFSSERQRSERWKEKLREDLVREHIEMKKKKNTPVRALIRKLIRLV